MSGQTSSMDDETKAALRDNNEQLYGTKPSWEVLAMIHRSSLPPVDLPLLSLPEFVLQRAAKVSDRRALIDGLTGRRLTYGELAEGPRRTVVGLAARGFRKGDAFTTWSQNVPEDAVALYGADGSVPLPRPDKPRAGKP